MASPAKKKIAVIGAGVSGVVSVKICLDYGLEPVCFEQKDDLGGLWYVQYPVPEHLSHVPVRVYDGLSQNSIKTLYTFSEFPALKHHPYYMKPEDVKEYLSAYADHFKLRKYFHFNQQVIAAEKAKEYSTTGRWNVTTVDAITKGDEQTEMFDGILMCQGMNSRPKIPDPFPEQNRFKGTIIHAADFYSSDPYRRKNVLILGAGISSMDIACMLAGRGANKVYIIAEHGVWLVPRTVADGSKGWEEVYSNNQLRKNPDAVKEKLYELSVRKLDPENLGLAPDRPFLSCVPALTDEADRWINNGIIKVVKSSISSFKKDGVTLKNGEDLEVDDVIFATGYKSSPFSFVKDEKLQKSGDSMQRWFWYWYPVDQEVPSLFLIQFVYYYSLIPATSELQARAACAILSGQKALPSKQEMEKTVEKQINDCMKSFKKPEPIFYSGPAAADQFAEFLGCLPNWSKIAAEDPVLAEIGENSPAMAAQYRLTGPHANWKLAADMIKERAWLDFSATRVEGWKRPKDSQENGL